MNAPAQSARAAGPQARPGARSEARAASESEDFARPDGRAPRARSALAEIAIEEFTVRRHALREASRSGRKPASQCEKMARCWLAIAAAAGATSADLPELADPDREGHDFRPWQIEDRADWMAELARARDAAVKKALELERDPALKQRGDSAEIRMRSFGLSSLALHMGIAFPIGSHSEPQGRPPAAASAAKPSGAHAPRPAPEGQNQGIAA